MIEIPLMIIRGVGSLLLISLLSSVELCPCNRKERKAYQVRSLDTIKHVH